MAPTSRSPADHSGEGEALFREKKYAEAAPKFHTASWRWPDSTLEEDALFLEGECYFFDDQYGKAQDAYDNLLKKHGNTRYLDTVMWRLFAIGRYWEQLDDGPAPLAGDAQFQRQDAAAGSIPGATPSAPTRRSICTIPAARWPTPRKWRSPTCTSAPAATRTPPFHYDIIRKDYPKSKYQMQAHILGLQSKMRMYQGPLYDVQPAERRRRKSPTRRSSSSAAGWATRKPA